MGLAVILSDMFFKFCPRSLADNFNNLKNTDIMRYSVRHLIIVFKKAFSMSDRIWGLLKGVGTGIELWVGIFLVSMQVMSCIHIIIFAIVGVILFIVIISIEIFRICVKNTIKF